jgi:CTP:molybdopterin cytidylyltransferase MocA
MIPVLILAAGQSRRMGGRDKLLEIVDGQPLILRQARMASLLGGPVFITLPCPDHPRAALLARKGPPDIVPVHVHDATEGIGHSIRAGAAALPKDADGVLILLADLPEIETSDLRALLEARDSAPDADVWRGTTQDGRGGHPLLLGQKLLAELPSLHGDRGAQPLIEAAQAAGRLVRVPLPGQRALTDLDTPDAWAAWRAANPDR